MDNRRCQWLWVDYADWWSTSCFRRFELPVDSVTHRRETPSHHFWNYCPACGKPIEEKVGSRLKTDKRRILRLEYRGDCPECGKSIVLSGEYIRGIQRAERKKTLEEVRKKITSIIGGNFNPRLNEWLALQDWLAEQLKEPKE